MKKLQVNPERQRTLKLDMITDSTSSTTPLISLTCKSVNGRREVNLKNVSVLEKFPSFRGQAIEKEDIEK